MRRKKSWPCVNGSIAGQSSTRVSIYVDRGWVRLMVGTGGRIQDFIDKARSGKPFTVSVIGGSVSKGRGLTPAEHRTRRSVLVSRQEDDSLPVSIEEAASEEAAVSQERPKPLFGADTLYSPENLHVLIFDWLNETFPHPQNRLVNGAQGGVGSAYFSWCFSGWSLYVNHAHGRGTHCGRVGSRPGGAGNQRLDRGGCSWIL